MDRTHCRYRECTEGPTVAPTVRPAMTAAMVAFDAVVMQTAMMIAAVASPSATCDPERRAIDKVSASTSAMPEIAASR